MTDAAIDVDGSGAEVGERAPGRGGGPFRDRVPRLVVLALLVIAVVLAMVAAMLRSDLTTERDDRDAVGRVSAEMATALLTYDHRDLAGWKERVLGDATPAFRRTFEETFAVSLEPVVTEVQGTSSATVEEVYVGTIADGAARAIVVLDTVATGTTGGRSQFDTYIRLDLVRVGGEWKVNHVTNLSVGAPEGAGDGNGSASPAVQGANT